MKKMTDLPNMLRMFMEEARERKGKWMKGAEYRKFKSSKRYNWIAVTGILKTFLGKETSQRGRKGTRHVLQVYS